MIFYRYKINQVIINIKAIKIGTIIIKIKIKLKKHKKTNNNFVYSQI
jgi:hypothetical protein